MDVKAGHYHEIKRVDRQGLVLWEIKGWIIMMCKLKGWMDKGGHYDVEMKGWMQKGGITMCKLKGRMDKGGHYDVEMKGWMEKVAL